MATVAGVLVAAGDFALNVLASLALLGPGLLITNVLARNWRFRVEGRTKAAQLTVLRDQLAWITELVIEASWLFLDETWRDNPALKALQLTDMPRAVFTAAAMVANSTLTDDIEDLPWPEKDGIQQPIELQARFLAGKTFVASDFALTLATLRQIGGRYPVLELRAGELLEQLKTPISMWAVPGDDRSPDGLWHLMPTVVRIVPEPLDRAEPHTILELNPFNDFYVYLKDFSKWLGNIGFALSGVYEQIDKELKEL